MQIAELAARLEPLGLEDKQARVYVAALFLGAASVQKIAQQAEINRATAYVILDQLAEIGLVSQTSEGKKTVFVAEPPEALVRIFDLQQRALEAQKDELKALMPDLKKTQRAQAEDGATPVVRFYRGKEGIKAVNAEARRKAKAGTEILGMTNYDEVTRIFPDIVESSPKFRLKKKISSKVLYSYKSTVASDKKLLRQTYKINEPVKADMSLINDQALLVSYGKRADGEDAVGVIIESKEIVSAMRQLFELAWKNK